MSDSSDAAKLTFVAQLYSTYSIFIIFGLGLIGNLFNILVFTNVKVFRHNRCAFYLIAESIVDIIQLTQTVFNEIWKSSINGVDPSSILSVWCKLKSMMAQWSRLMVAVIICLAAIDQFLSTNHAAYLRRFSSLKVAKRQIFFASLICLLHTIPFIIFQDARSSSGCIVVNTGLSDYYSFFYYPVLNGLLPILVSSLFSILAYRNVRRIIRRQIPIDRRRLDQQLTAMIFVRVIAHVILSLPYTIYRIYVLNVKITRNDVYLYALIQLVSAIVISLIFVNHAASFYIFLATSARYRRQVKILLKKKYWQSLSEWCCGHESAIRPLGRTSSERDNGID